MEQIQVSPEEVEKEMKLVAKQRLVVKKRKEAIRKREEADRKKKVKECEAAAKAHEVYILSVPRLFAEEIDKMILKKQIKYLKTPQHATLERLYQLAVIKREICAKEATK